MENKYKEFKTVEEMRNDEELQYMGRYQWQKVKIDGKEVFACTTDQQYENIICTGIDNMLCDLFEHFNLDNGDICDFIPDIRDLVIRNLKENGIEFVNVYEEY